MKKNWTMRVALLLVALTLITSCFVSGTYAKYVTSGNGTDTARVAKFGVTVTAEGSAFATEYAADDDSFTLAENTVVSTEKVVAPGTKGDVAAVALEGTPEVAVRVTYTVTVEKEGWTVDNEEYFPIVFTVNGTAYDTIDAAVEAANAYTKDYEAGTNLEEVEDDALAISWEWPFEVEGNDVKDTALGDAAAAGNAATITITVTATVTQID